MNNRQTYDGMCFRKGNDNRSLIMKNVQNMQNMQDMQNMQNMQTMQNKQNMLNMQDMQSKQNIRIADLSRPFGPVSHKSSAAKT